MQKCAWAQAKQKQQQQLLVYIDIFFLVLLAAAVVHFYKQDWNFNQLPPLPIDRIVAANEKQQQQTNNRK